MSEFRFEGGPLDGFTVAHPEVNLVADSLPPITAGRSFLSLPSLDQCERILRGELTKAGVQGPYHVYELFSRGEGAVVFRSSPDGLASAFAERDAPLEEEAQNRRQEFENLADEFTRRVREFQFTSDSVVELLMYYADDQGNPIPEPQRTELSTPLILKGFPSDEATRAGALRMYVKNVIDNIDSLVRGATPLPIPVNDGTGRKVRYLTFELEIRAL
ncbi:hypothetical protein [Frigoriglobus tundricola]|uniref:Uncharacterized protein n=1 Tax=Frigoriglobus tundricola TaxID=2774151 RepID=A0A6M5Z467_9BACT|nr:hypothetical protein [Frigoriglobus tundricola]QJX01198.1 hypothetical protein FTUN_8837 [Frigoriglobus tundricola]